MAKGWEALVIDVHPYADDRVVHALTRQAVFDEDAGELAVAPVDVVGPLDGQALALLLGHEGGEGAADGYGDELGDGELLTSLQHVRAQEQRAGDAVALTGDPAIAAHPSACRLLTADDGVQLRKPTPRGDLLHEVGVGAIDLVDEL